MIGLGSDKNDKRGQIYSGRNQHPWGQAAPEDGQYCLHPGPGGADDVVDIGVVVLLMMWWCC